MTDDPLARVLADAWDDAPVEAFVDDPSASILAAIPPDTADAMRDEVESLRRAVATFDRALGIVVAALPDDPWLGRDGTCYACGGSRPLHPAPCAWVEAYHVRRGR